MTAVGTPLAATPPVARVSTGRVLRAELIKLAAQGRTWVGLGSAFLAPLVLVGAMSLPATSLPKDAPFGRYLRDTGAAGPLVLLGFGGLWFLPLLSAIVTGDLFSAEDHHGTWKTCLTRSIDRRTFFRAKVLAGMLYTVALMVILATVSIVASGLRFGFHPLISLSGEDIPPGRALGLIVAAWALSLLPLLAFTAMAVASSVFFRNGIAGVVMPVVVSFAMQLLGFLNAGGSTARHYLLTTQFEAFHGLFHDPSYHSMVIRAIWVSAAYAVPPIVVASAIFRRRDITGG